jgi:cobaltochelatase CobN
MHLLPVTSVSLDEADRAIDLDQAPGDVIVLSFTDSDLAALAVAYRSSEAPLPSLRLANLRQLRHPLSVDLYAERTVRHARFVLVRCLGGLDYWRYGLERLKAVCAQAGVVLAVLPGDDRPDSRLDAFSTAPAALNAELDAYFRAGGIGNLRALLQRVAQFLGLDCLVPPPLPIPRAFAWSAGAGPSQVSEACAALPASRPVAYLLVYRSAVLSGDAAAIAAFADALEAQGVAVVTIAVASLKDCDAIEAVRQALEVRRPDIVVTTTAFAARDEAGFVLDEADCPVLQAIAPGSPREAWRASSRGLSAADLTMQVVLPEFDGRIAVGPIAFKEERAVDDELGFVGRRQVPDRDGIALAAAQAVAWIRLRSTVRADRRLAIVLSDYPARGGRAGFAVGLDSPASICRIVDLLTEAGYDAGRSFDSQSLMQTLTEGEPSFLVPVARYETWLSTLAPEMRASIEARWGACKDDPALADGAFRFRVVRAGKVLVALQPARSRGVDRKATYHDPDAPPTHAYLAFYLGLREVECLDAVVHLGTHGTTEWLPGKSVALSDACWPRVVTGALPVVYPFIVDDPGEAAPAKRRLPGITIGHLTPAVATAGLSDAMATLRELVEEYSSAQVMDPRRASIVAREIIERAEVAGVAAACGVTRETPIEKALTTLDAHLCDLAEVTIRDGLHIFGEAPPVWDACAQGERDGLVRALDGRFVIPGPAGSPSRGRLDVLPTGRNLATLDPRAIPTRAAAVLGERAAAEVVRRHLQEEGDYPRRIVMDLWASPALRSGGEDVAHVLALMGVRPQWDHASTRVTGFEIVPLAHLDRPRIDVTVRISGVFRDTFPDQITLIDRAVRAVADLREDDAWNALACAGKRGETLTRIFGAAPGRYGAGVAGETLDGAWTERMDLGRAYLAMTSHAFGRAENGTPDPSFARRIKEADAFVHIGDVAERDILDGDSVADAIGGFAAAAQAMGREAALYSVDTSRPSTPKARTLAEDVLRIVHGRLVHPRWIEGQLRHGWRGAAELAQAVDAVFVFAATTDAVSSEAFEVIYATYVADSALFNRLQAANPAAAQAIVDRLSEARRRGLWASRRNSVGVRPRDRQDSLP